MPYQGEFLLLLDALGGDIFIPTNIFELGESGQQIKIRKQIATIENPCFRMRLAGFNFGLITF